MSKKFSKTRVFLFLIVIFVAVLGVLYFIPSDSSEANFRQDESVIKPKILGVDDNGSPIFSKPEVPSVLNVTLNSITSGLQSESDLSIGLNIKKTDSNGKISEEKLEEKITPLTLILENNNLVDYSKGSYEFGLFVKFETRKTIELMGEMDLLLNNELVKSIDFVGGGIPSKSGILLIPFKTDSGYFQVNIGELMDQMNEGKNTISLKMNNAKFVKNLIDSKLPDKVIYEIELEKDDFKTLVTNDSGQVIKVYKSDIPLRVSSMSKLTGNITYCRSDIPNSRDPTVVYAGNLRGTNILGEVRYMPVIDLCGGAYCIEDFAPIVGPITVKDKITGKIIASSPKYNSNGYDLRVERSYGWSLGCNIISGGTGQILIDTMLQRNHDYVISIGSPQNIVSEFHTPESYREYYFKCGSTIRLNCGID